MGVSETGAQIGPVIISIMSKRWNILLEDSESSARWLESCPDKAVLMSSICRYHKASFTMKIIASHHSVWFMLTILYNQRLNVR